jgi:hypothetical protein
MRSLYSAVLLLVWAAASAQQPAPVAPSETACAPLGSSYMRTTMYFGLNRKGGTISPSQWKAFVRDEVTSRFPQGLTVWEAGGQWRRADGAIIQERSKILLLVHDDQPAVRAALAEIVDRYKRLFAQESVLWESARVCAAF